MQKDVTKRLLRGSAVMVRMRSESIGLVNVLLELLTVDDICKGPPTTKFSVAAEGILGHWEYSHIGPTWNLSLWEKGRATESYLVASIGSEGRVNMSHEHRSIRLLHAALPAFVEGMLETFPILCKRTVPFLSVADAFRE